MLTTKYILDISTAEHSFDENTCVGVQDTRPVERSRCSPLSELQYIPAQPISGSFLLNVPVGTAVASSRGSGEMSVSFNTPHAASLLIVLLIAVSCSITST